MENDAQNFLINNTPNEKIRVAVFLQNEILWLTQKAIANLFETTPQNITIHVKNIYEVGELVEMATCKEFLQVQQEGNRLVERNQKYYNLDAIISVGYRVNSSRATQFRIWGNTNAERIYH